MTFGFTPKVVLVGNGDLSASFILASISGIALKGQMAKVSHPETAFSCAKEQKHVQNKHFVLQMTSLVNNQALAFKRTLS